MSKRKEQPALTTADIPAMVAFLEKEGYCINAPPPPAPVADPPVIDMDADVEEARTHLEYLRRLEEDADERCMGTPMGDSDLPRYRRESTAASDRVLNAEERLRKAVADRQLMSS